MNSGDSSSVVNVFEERVPTVDSLGWTVAFDGGGGGGAAAAAAAAGVGVVAIVDVVVKLVVMVVVEVLVDVVNVVVDAEALERLSSEGGVEPPGEGGVAAGDGDCAS
jgi:hypothetical protein